MSDKELSTNDEEMNSASSPMSPMDLQESEVEEVVMEDSNIPECFDEKSSCGSNILSPSSSSNHSDSYNADNSSSSNKKNDAKKKILEDKLKKRKLTKKFPKYEIRNSSPSSTDSKNSSETTSCDSDSLDLYLSSSHDGFVGYVNLENAQDPCCPSTSKIVLPDNSSTEEEDGNKTKWKFSDYKGNQVVFMF